MGVGHLDVPCSLGGAEKEASGEAWFDIISWFRDGGSLLSTVDFQPLNWSTNCARTSEMLFSFLKLHHASVLPTVGVSDEPKGGIG